MSAQTVLSKGVSFKQVAFSTLISIAASIAVNLILLFLFKALFTIPAEFSPLTPVPIMIFSTVGIVAAGVVYAIVARVAKNPNFVYRIVALVALVLSILPNFASMANPSLAPFPGGSALTFGLLIIFHITSALVTVSVLTARPSR